MDREILRDLSYGVYVVTTKKDNKNVGCICNSIMQITSDKIAISVNHDNYTNSSITKSNKFAVSILSKNADLSIIGMFGYNSSKDIDKFKDIDYEIINDVPIIINSIGYIICDVTDKMETETHTIFLGKISDCKKNNDETPMTYAYYHNELKGKTPKNAPTYMEEEITKVQNKNTFVCTVCGYKYETDLDELPEDFKCPICGKGKEYFKKL